MAAPRLHSAGPGARVRVDEDREAQRGFTLLELLVTLAILGFALVLIIGYKPPWSHTLALNGAAAEIEEGLRAARSEAILRNRQVTFDIDLTNRRFRVGSGPVRQLPPHLAISLLTIASERRDSKTGSILFNPDGSSTGGQIALADGPITLEISVSWLTGRVGLASGP